MPVLATKLVVEFDHGETVPVTTDQRDLAAWEVQPFHDDSRSHLRARFLAWNALRRSGSYSKPFDTFNATDCAEVRNDTPADDQGDGDGLDPGERATSDGRSST